MRNTECEREQDVLDAIAAGCWPEKASGDLSSHVASCSLCTELALVSQAFQEDFEAALKHARLPSAGLVWWRAEIRSRQEAIRTASRPITLVQGIAGMVGIGALIVVLTRIDFTAVQNINVAGWQAFLPDALLPLPLLYLAIAIVLVLTPIALYFVLSDD